MDGSKPGGSLTPADAEERLHELLAAVPRKATVPKQHEARLSATPAPNGRAYMPYSPSRMWILDLRLAARFRGIAVGE